MFCRCFGNFLLSKKIITEEQFEQILEYRKNNRVKLGLIAVEQKLLTAAKADEVNRLQMKMDKRFGDIAVEKGYLTNEDVSKLLKLQGNPYLLFVQAVSENDMLTKEKVDAYLLSFQRELSYSDALMEALKNGDVDNVIASLVKVEEPYRELIQLMLKNIIRFASTDLLVGKLEKVKEVKMEHAALQVLEGDDPMMVALTCNQKELLAIASPYGREEFTQVDEDALDAIGEFINCTDGLFATKLSQDNIELEMLPPQYYGSSVFSTDGEFYVLPIQVSGQWVKLVILVKSQWYVK